MNFKDFYRVNKLRSMLKHGDYSEQDLLKDEQEEGGFWSNDLEQAEFDTDITVGTWDDWASEDYLFHLEGEDLEKLERVYWVDGTWSISPEF